MLFRYDLTSQILIYAWVNDKSTQHAYDSKHNAYAVFCKMLEPGNPPDSWGDVWQTASGDDERITALLDADATR